MRVVLVDDHTLVRGGLRALMEDLPDITVVAEAGNAVAGLAAVRLHQPDVLVTDLTMEGMSGIELTVAVKDELPATQVIILSMFSSEELVLHALKAGAAAYLLKDSSTLELELAFAAVARGDSYLSPSAARHLVEHVRAGAEPDPLIALTMRQREILKLIAEGVHTKEIAHQLKLSSKTVNAHRAQIMHRLNIRDVASLVRLAIRAGLISP